MSPLISLYLSPTIGWAVFTDGKVSHIGEAETQVEKPLQFLNSLQQFYDQAHLHQYSEVLIVRTGPGNGFTQKARVMLAGLRDGIREIDCRAVKDLLGNPMISKRGIMDAGRKQWPHLEIKTAEAAIAAFAGVAYCQTSTGRRQTSTLAI